MSVDSDEANGALRLLTEINAAHQALVEFTSGFMGLGLFGDDVELTHAVLTTEKGDGIRVESRHRFGVLSEGGSDLNEVSISCGLLIGGSGFFSYALVEADYDFAAGALLSGRTVLLDERESSHGFRDTLTAFRDRVKRVVDSPELFSGLTSPKGVG